MIQTKKDDGPVIPQHRLAGGGISTDMLKDPSENERMERVRKYEISAINMNTHDLTFRWVNNQDFSRASPEPPLPSDTTRGDQQTQQDLYNALQKHMQPITMLHHGVHPFLSKVTRTLLPFSSAFFSRTIGQLWGFQTSVFYSQLTIYKA